MEMPVLDISHEISLSQDPKTHRLLSRMSFNHETLSKLYKFESKDPVVWLDWLTG